MWVYIALRFNIGDHDSIFMLTNQILTCKYYTFYFQAFDKYLMSLLLICPLLASYLFQMYLCLLHVLYWSAFSHCNTMGAIELDLYLLRQSFYGSYLLVEWVCITFATVIHTSYLQSPQHTCTTLSKILASIVGGHWAVSFSAWQVSVG